MLPVRAVGNREKAGGFRTLAVTVEADGLVMVRGPRLLNYSAAFAAAGRKLPLRTAVVAAERYCNGGFEAFVPDLPRTADGKSTSEQHDR